MDSRERVIAALERRRPDRPPTSVRFTPEALERMRVHLNLPPSADLLNDVCDALDIDVRWVGVPYIGPKERATPNFGGEGTDFWGIRYTAIRNESNTYFDIASSPLAGARTVADVENHDWPSLDWWDYAALPGIIRAAQRKGRRAILYFAGGAFETPWYIRGLEQFLVDLHEQPEIPAAICTRVEEYYRLRALRAIEAADGIVDIVGSGGDIGEQQRMLLSPGVWRARIKPYTGRLITTFKRMGLKTFYHSDGSIVPVIDDFIELGLDVLDPIQVGAAGMRPEELYPRFGDRISFHGAIDEQQLLPHGTVDQVYRETVRTIDILGARGGYIVSPTHMVQGDTPPENVAAIYRAASEYRWRES